MKKIILYLLIPSAILGCVKTPIDEGYIKIGRVKGYIFPKEQKLYIEADENIRYTPSREDITKVEETLKEKLGEANKNQPNQGKDCPVIHKNLLKYSRQYVGYINESGEKIVWINLIWDKGKETESRLSKDVIIILDGCSYYWNIKVNLTKETLYDLQVNGSA